MEAVLALFVAIVVACTWGGVALIRRAVRAPKEPTIPTARTANPATLDAAYAKAARAPRKVGKGILFTLGAGLLVAPWAAVYAVFKDFSEGFGLSKGRVLRIKNRAQLPELATGDGWGTDEVHLAVPADAGARAILGELWLLTARMEHASIAAFSQLGLHLAALGAPARLHAAAHRAALEEIRHAERCFAIVRAITGVPHTAGPIVALADTASSIDLARLAVGSLVDGCLAEGIAADVAAHGAALATEPAIRETLSMIAREEEGHAELAWDILAWALARGGAQVSPAVAARVDRLAQQLTPPLPALEGIDDITLARFGVVDQGTLGELAARRVAAVQQRARMLVQDAQQQRAA